MLHDWKSEIEWQRTAAINYLHGCQERWEQADLVDEKQKALQELLEARKYLDLLRDVRAYMGWRLRTFQAWCASPY